MIEYFHHNAVFPAAAILSPMKFKQVAPYLTKDDEILIVIKGLTDFKLSEVYQLFKDLDEYKEKLGKITILSNVHLGVVPYVYYLYEGDLFYGSLKRVERGKVRDLTAEELGDFSDIDNPKKTKKPKPVDVKEVPPELLKNNTVMAGFKKYNYRKIKLIIYGRDADVNKSDDNVSQKYVDLMSKIVAVNLYE